MSVAAFAEDLEIMCLNAGIISSYFGQILDEISNRVPFDSLTAHYISAGPFPVLPEMKLDVFLLTDAFIYNHAVSTEGSDEWFILPLTGISYIKESRTPDNDFWSMAITAQSQGVSGLVLVDDIENRDKIRAFTNLCRDNLAAIIQLGK